MGRRIADSPVFRVSRLLGLTPFNGDGKRTKSLLVYSVVFSTFTSVFCVLSRFYILDALKNIDASAFISTLLQMISVLSMWTHVGVSCSNASHFKTVMSIRRRNRTANTDIFLLTAGAVLHGIAFLDTADLVSSFLNTSVVLASFMNYLIALQFHSILGILSAETADLFIKPISKEYLMFNHNFLLEAAKMTNRIYQRQLLIILAQVFGYGTNYSFTLFLHLKSGFQWSEFSFLGFFIAMLVARGLTLLSITHGCENFKIQVGNYIRDLKTACFPETS